jgi:hypothetical protein
LRYYNMAAYIRRATGLKDKVEYGPDCGASVTFPALDETLAA